MKQPNLDIHSQAPAYASPYAAAPNTASNNIYSTPGSIGSNMYPSSNYTQMASPYAAPPTSTSNIYSTPYGQTPHFNSQFVSPPAYSNSSFANQDNSFVDRKFWVIN